jgi:hypothetical protein
LSKEDFKIFQKIKFNPLRNISKNAKVTLIGDSIEQSDFGKVDIALVIDNKCYKRKVIVKMLFQGKKNELKNESEMGEIIRKIFHDVDKAKLIFDILFLECHAIANARQWYTHSIAYFRKDDLNTLARKTKEIEGERKKI